MLILYWLVIKRNDSIRLESKSLWGQYTLEGLIGPNKGQNGFCDPGKFKNEIFVRSDDCLSQNEFGYSPSTPKGHVNTNKGQIGLTPWP